MNKIDIAQMDLNLLKALNALLEEKHVGRAADRMNISQSAMSHTLARLRDAFNDPLFIRNSKGIEPTGRALDLAESLSKILSDINGLLTPDKLNPENIDIRFRIQTHDYIATEVLPSRLRHVQSLASNVVFDIQSYHTHSYDDLDRGKVDMIIGAGLSANPKFFQRKIMTDELVCLLRKGHPVLKTWTTKGLFQYPHLKLSLLEGQNDPINKVAKKVGEKRFISLLTDSLHTQPKLLVDSDAIAFVPKTLAKASCDYLNLEFKKTPFALDDIDVKLIWHARYHSDLAHAWIRRELFEGAID